MKRLFLILIFLLSESGFGQTVLEGTVQDAETGEAIPGANVYLAETTFGTSTDRGGYYQFSTSASGPYELVFSFVGYQKRDR